MKIYTNSYHTYAILVTDTLACPFTPPLSGHPAPQAYAALQNATNHPDDHQACQFFGDIPDSPATNATPNPDATTDPDAQENNNPNPAP